MCCAAPLMYPAASLAREQSAAAPSMSAVTMHAPSYTCASAASMPMMRAVTVAMATRAF
jgi:hypothetical protein